MFYKDEYEGNKILYSLKEVSKITGLSEGHIRNENKRGKLKFVKSGGRTLILDSELRRYLKECEA